MSIPGASNPLLLASAATAEDSYAISRSLRFNSGDSAYLSRTPSSAGNRKTWTWSGWVKRSKIGATQCLYAAGTNASTAIDTFEFSSSDKLEIYSYSGSYAYNVVLSQLFRDTSAWFNLIIALNTTELAAADRLKVYVNGERVVDFDTASYPSQNADTHFVNTTNLHNIGYQLTRRAADLYLADVQFLDGIAASPTDLGETDSNGVWQPKEYSGSYGTNGFHLQFADNSSDAALGLDTSDATNTLNNNLNFTTVTYTGNGSTQNIDTGFQPDFLWIKSRNSTYDHYLQDSVRGATKTLEANQTGAETTNADGVSSFEINGFSVGAGTGYTAANVNNINYVAWAWKANGAAVSNTDGSITSQVSANQDYGFSVCTYTGTGSSGTIGHGLGIKPKVVLIKNRSAAADWGFYYDLVDGTMDRLLLNATSAASNQSVSAPTTSVFSTQGGSGDGANNENYVAYIWSEVAGFSKFGTFSGSGASGNKITTGFKPKFLLIKSNDTVSNWFLLDSERGSAWLEANGSAAENSNSNIAISYEADGFTPTGSNVNNSGTSYIYMAFADNPGNDFVVNNLAATTGETEADKSFDAVTYTGNGGTQSISSLSFSPDLVWIKSRTGASTHSLQDSVRGFGANTTLRSDVTNATDSGAYGYVSALSANGFTVAPGSANDASRVNGSGQNYVAWAWNAGANSNKTYTVKVVSDSGNKYRFDDFGTSAVTLDLAEGSTYVFDQSDSSNSGHPIRFGTSANGTDYTTGVTHTGTPGSAGAKTTLVLASGAATLYYSCLNHSGMGGQINTNSTAGASNFDGSVQSVVKASQAKGFSIVTASPSNNAVSIGHGLNKTPSMIISKSRDNAYDWNVYHTSLGVNDFLRLNTSAAKQTSSGYWGTVNSSVFGTASGNNGNNTGNMLYYVWSEIAGFSKFGKYTGNGSTTGPVVTLGFRPRYVLIKNATGSANNWMIIDSERGGDGDIDELLFASSSSSENTSQNRLRFTNTGFQVIDSSGGFNENNKTFIYAAFAANFSNAECDSLVDTPEQRAGQTDSGAGNEVVGNYATINALQNIGADTFSDGNLKIVTSSSNYGTHTSTIATPLSGKWYAEIEVASATTYSAVGLVAANSNFTTTSWPGSLNGVAYYGNNGNKYVDTTSTSYGASFGNGDVIGIAYDADNLTVAFYKNGTSQGAINSVTSRNYYFGACNFDSGSATYIWNFGARPWAYPNSVPSGYKALNTANLPTATIADGSQYFDAKLYTGDNTAARSVSSYNFSPDFVWAKSRSGTYYHGLFDTLRSGYALYSNATSVEDTTEQIGFASNGFTTPNKTGDFINANNASYVAWAWDAGSSTVTNTDGSISSQVRANPTAGFSICTYTGTEGGTFGHGLNAAPEFVMVKRRNNSAAWCLWHKAIPNTQYLMLNSTAGANTYNVWGNTSPTSSVVTVSGDSYTGNNGDTYVAYCFAPVAGYSAFGSYTGNGSTDGPFVFTGFRPSFVIQKRTDGTGNWRIRDNARSTYNVIEDVLYADTSASTITEDPYDFLSNGFKIRTSGPHNNASGGSYIYIAFAENPFSLARAR